MRPSLNKVMLIGSVCREPEMRYTPAGRPVTVFSIHVARSDDAASQESPNVEGGVSVVAWDGLAERCAQQVVSEAQIYVEGSLETRIWTDAGGDTCARLEVAASDMVVLGRSGDRDRQRAHDDYGRPETVAGQYGEVGRSGDHVRENDSAAGPARTLP